MSDSFDWVMTNDVRAMAASHAPTCQAVRVNLRVTQLLKANRFEMAVYQRYLKWVLRLKCEIRMARMTRWLADCPSLFRLTNSSRL